MKTKYAIIAVLLISLFGKAFGFIRDILITNYLGFGMKTDALLLSLSIITTVFSVFQTTIRTTFSPMFSSNYLKNSKEVLSEYNNIRNILIFLSTILFFIFAIFSRQIIILFAPGFNSDSIEIAGYCLRVLSVLLVFYNIYYLTTGFLQSIKVFTTFETANLFNNIIIILFIVLLFGRYGLVSILLGYIFGSIFQMIFSRRILNRKINYKFNYKINFRSDSWITFTNYSKFVLLGTLVSQLTAFSDKFVASFLTEGSISALHYASLIKNLPLTIVVLSVTNVLFTDLSIAYENNLSKFKNKVYFQLKNLIYLITPFTLVLFVFSEEIIKLLFYRGEFTLEGVEMTSSALRAYALGMYFWVVKEQFSKVSYAAKNTKIPLIISIISLLINFILNVILGFYFGHIGVAYSTTCAILINSVMIIYLLHKKNIVLFEKRDLFYFLRVTSIFSFLLIITLLVKRLVVHFGNEFLILSVGSLIVFILCLLVSKTMGVKLSDFLKKGK